MILSQSSCGDLGWTNIDQYGSTGVCGASEISGSCSGAVSWAAAEAFCSDAGARLCTVAELQADETRGTGCQSNNALVWTSEVCGTGHSVAPGATTRIDAPSCNADGSSGINARCCADVATF